MERDTILGICFAVYVALLFVMGVVYICEFDVIYQDKSGKVVVCDVDGTFYSADRQECKDACKGKWKRTNMLIWQGTCNQDGICTPKEDIK